jgi:hypothetical protein
MNNLLKMALSIIPKSAFTLESFSSKTTNTLGYSVNVFSTAEAQSGIVQVIQNSTYQSLGLDFSQNYIEVWAETAINGLDKQEVADRIIYNGGTYNVIKSNDWSVYNGWSSVVAVEDKSL